MPGLWTRFSKRASAAAGDRRGAILLVIAFAVIPLVGALGLATDAARGYLVKQKLSRAIDIAALAGAKVIDDPDLDGIIQMFFTANFPPGFLDSVVDGPNYEISQDNEKLTLIASATINTTFMSVLGFKTLQVSAYTEVTRESSYLDVVLAIDMSNSMNDNVPGSFEDRIDAAREAALVLVDDLFGEEETQSALKIGLVPWNDKVNVWINGSSYIPSSTTSESVPPFTNPVTGDPQSVVYYANNSPVPLLFDPPSSWKGCVWARFVDDGDGTNDADTDELPGSFGNKDWPGWETTWSTGGGGWGGWGGGGGSGNTNDGYCLNHGITPLQSTKTAISDAIGDLTHPDGATNIPQGLAWAWRVLTADPPFDEADPDPDFPLTRAIVLLTDGENFNWSTDAYHGDLTEAELDDRLRALAAKIKAQGIKIITIQFANGSGALADLMKEVASSSEAPYYNYAPDAATLQQIFKDVASELSNLRISQ